MTEHRGERFVVGIDFGTLSGRAVITRVSDGEILGEAVHPYEHGAMDRVLTCLLYTSPSPRDGLLSRMPSSA